MVEACTSCMRITWPSRFPAFWTLATTLSASLESQSSVSMDQVTMLRPQVVFSVLFMDPYGGRSSVGVMPSTSWKIASAAA